MELLLLAALGIAGYFALRTPAPGPTTPVVTNPMTPTSPVQPTQYIPGTMIPVVLSPPAGFPPSGFPAISLPPGFPFPTGFAPTDINTNTFAAKPGDALALYFDDPQLAQLGTTDPATYAANQISEALRQYGFEFQLMNVAGPSTSAIQVPGTNSWLVMGNLVGGTSRTLPRDLTMNPRITVLATRPSFIP